MSAFDNNANLLKLSAVVFHLDSCRNSCLFCNPGRMRRKASDVEIKTIETNILSQIMNLKKRGFTAIEISGSDPIEYKKLPQFIRWLKTEMGFTFVILATHGRNLEDKKTVEQLKAAGLNELRIPVYGSKADIHDAVTQENGSFDETMAGISNTIEIAPDIQITGISLILKQNYFDIVNIQKHLAKYCHFMKFGMPGISRLELGSNYTVKLSEIKPYLIKLAARMFESKAPFAITDIPFCVFGFYQHNIINYSPDNMKGGLPDFADNYSVPDTYKSNDKHLPSYRVKTKLDICKNCSLDNICGGFHKNYFELYGTEHFDPL